MLTPQQYEAIGRLTLAFNDIEYIIDVYLTHILGSPEWSVSLLLAERQRRFGNKIDLLNDVLKAIRVERPTLESQINCVLLLLGKSSTLANERDSYAHALVVSDLKTSRTVLRIKRKGKADTSEITCREDAITKLAVDASELADQINAECGDLLAALDEARELL